MNDKGIKTQYRRDTHLYDLLIICKYIRFEQKHEEIKSFQKTKGHLCKISKDNIVSGRVPDYF